MSKVQISSTDARVVVLKKQHYLDTYDSEMQCQYSCWGYYDGIDISPCQDVESGLYKKETNSPLSMLWYGMEVEYEKLRGVYGIQTVGIFRDADRKSNDFWSNEKYGIYFCICFIQLLDRKTENREILKSTIENEMSSHECRCLVYYTIDNAELVVVLNGNSLQTLQKTVNEIERGQNVAYIHSVEGIKANYLVECETNGKILRSWNGWDCRVDEEIQELRLKIAVSDIESIMAKKEELEDVSGKWPLDTLKELNQFSWYHAESHESLVLSSNRMRVKDLIKFLIPGGLITHQNSLYSQGLYNIHTSVIMNSEMRRAERKANLQSSYPRWCNAQMVELAKLAKEMKRDKNDGFYACATAAQYSLNTLAQYEGFCLSNDLYALLIPSIRMFVDSFRTAWQELKSIDKTSSEYLDKLFALKKDTKDFRGKVNSFIYHAIHTDQVYLMLPGNCGTPYVLPIRLQIVYLWFVNKLTELFNDQDNVEYQFFIEPVSEDKPETYKITLGLERKDSLINLVLPQRSLYFPRALLLILCHETLHYVNEKIRRRGDRFRFLASAYAEFLVSYYMNDVTHVIEQQDLEIERLEEAFRQMKFHLQERLRDYFFQGYSESEDEDKDHADKVEVLLRKKAVSFFSNAAKRQVAFPQTELERLNKLVDNSDGIKNRECVFKTIQACLQSMANRAAEMIIEDKAEEDGSLIQNSLMKIKMLFKEIFADMTAVTILESSFDHFEEAYQLSEGLAIEAPNRDYVLTVRSRMMDSYINRNDIYDNEGVRSPEEEVKGSDRVYFDISVDTYIRYYIYLCEGTLKSYMNEIDMSEIRHIYRHFVAGGEKYTMSGLMKMFDECREKYEHKVREIIGDEPAEI